MDRLVLRMLAKAPDDRPPTMDAVAQDLAPFRTGAELAAPNLTLKLDPPLQQASPSAGATQLLPETERERSKGTSTLGMSAAEVVADPPASRRRTGLWVGLGAVAAAGLAVALFRPGQKPQPPVESKPVVAQRVHAAVDVPNTSVTEQPPATVTIQLESQPPGASVWIGDAAEPRGKTPLRLVVPRRPEPVQATLKADGYADRTISFAADHDQTVEGTLQALETPRHPAAAGGHGAHHGPRAGVAHAKEPVRPAAVEATNPPPPPKPQKKYYMLGD
jgi:hypothetical protein